MKKFFAIFICLTILLISACGNSSSTEDANSANNKEITLDLSFGSKTGTYTGTLNDNGLPEGQGAFTTTNSEGVKWTYTGEFVNGQFEGEGITEWEDGYYERGTYHESVLQPLDFTNMLYEKILANPDDYEGYFVEFTGIVANVLGYDENNYLHFQVFLDINNWDNAVYILADTDEEYMADEYVKIRGRINGIIEGDSILGGKVTNPLVFESEIKKISYIEAASKTIKEVIVDDTQTQYGYSVTVQKVEFAENETRIYIKVENNGSSKFTVYDWNSEIEQKNHQFSYQMNWDGNYPELMDDLRPGNITEGIITFPALDIDDFKLYLNCRSDNWNEEIDEITFDIIVD